MKGRIWMIRNRKKQWYFKVVARNGRILCHSESYSSRTRCFNAIKSMIGIVIEGGQICWEDE